MNTVRCGELLHCDLIAVNSEGLGEWVILKSALLKTKNYFETFILRNFKLREKSGKLSRSYPFVRESLHL